MFPVKGFQQRGGGVAPVIGAQLVDLVQHHQRVAALGLDDAADDAPRHSADIGLSVAPDLRLVVHAAERDAHRLPVGGSGDAHGDAGLAGARRAHKADQAALELRRQFFHRQILDDALLHFVQAEVILVQDLPGFFQIHGLLGLYVPGDIQAHIQVSPDDRGLGGAEGLLGEPGDFLQELCPDLLADRQSVDLLPVVLHIILAVLAKLRLNDLHLFPQVVFPLAAVHLLLGGLVQLFFNGEDIQLIVQKPAQKQKAAAGIDLLQNLLLILDAEAHILGDVVDHIGYVGVGKDIEKLLVHHIRVHMQILVKKRQAVSDQRLLASGAYPLRLVVKAMNKRGIIFPLGVNGGGLSPVKPLHQHPADIAAGLAELLADTADRAHMVDVLVPGHIGGDILLGGKKNELVCLHRLIQRRHRRAALHIKGQQHPGKHAEPPEREQRHDFKFLFHIV